MKNILFIYYFLISLHKIKKKDIMSIIELEEKPIFVVADIHGEFDYFEKNIDKNNLTDCIIIVAGDCGFGFNRKPYYERIFSSMNRHLVERNIHCYMIRGNHDDPYYFNNDVIKYSNVQTISDYTVLSSKKHNILCIGGAVSIDRKWRINHYWRKIEDYATIMNVTLEDAKSKFLPFYWQNESPIFDESKLNELIDNNIQIDIVVTHTSPSFAFKSDNNGIEYWLKIDEALENDLENEREAIDKIYNKLLSDNHPIKKWVYGHFHEHNNEMINNIEFTALINCDYVFDVKELNAYDL